MKRTSFWTTTVILTALVAPVWAANLSIVPGQSIGELKLGENLDDADLGQPDAARSDAAMGKAWTVYPSKTSRQPNGSFNTLSVWSARNFGHDNDAAHVQIIRVTSPAFQTANGVSTASALNQIRRAFPDARKIAWYQDTPAARVNVFDDAKRGIAFEVISGGRTLAITVHRTGHSVLDSYIGQHNYHRLERTN